MWGKDGGGGGLTRMRGKETTLFAGKKGAIDIISEIFLLLGVWGRAITLFYPFPLLDASCGNWYDLEEN